MSVGPGGVEVTFDARKTYYKCQQIPLSPTFAFDLFVVSMRDVCVWRGAFLPADRALTTKFSARTFVHVPLIAKAIKGSAL